MNGHPSLRHSSLTQPLSKHIDMREAALIVHNAPQSQRRSEAIARLDQRLGLVKQPQCPVNCGCVATDLRENAMASSKRRHAINASP